MRTVIKNEFVKLVKTVMKLVWNFMVLFVNGTPEKDMSSDPTVKQYIIAKSFYDKMYNDIDVTFNINDIKSLYTLVDTLRLEALKRCGSAISEEERKFMNGILLEMTEMADDLRETLLKNGESIVSNEQLIIDQKRFVRYTMARVQWAISQNKHYDVVVTA